jgi:UDPglucose 6-dehydrogenase
MFVKVTVFGIGYVGLVQAAVLAQAGHNVVCVDINQDKVDNLNRGVIPIYEPGLSSLVKEGCSDGRLQFTTSAADGIQHGDIQLIAVGTPPDENGSADLQSVLSVAETIATCMAGYKLVVTKSTVPVGTADLIKSTMKRVLEARKKNQHFDVASCPEFLKEGAAVADCMKPDRIIVGTDSDEVKTLMRELYAPFSRNHDKLIFMDVRSAEMTKYAANGMLATKISFMNEMANIAELLGADIEMVRQGIGADPRIGYQFIYPGCGYGGSCFPKDIKALIRTANEHGYQPALLESVKSVNDRQKEKLFHRITQQFGDDLSGKQFALWGLSFKPKTDDMREATSRTLMESLWQAGATVKAYDPEAMDECQRIYGNRDDLMLMGTKESCLGDCDALIICTEWSQFRAPDFDLMGDRLKQKMIFDGRNLFEPKLLENKGFTYFAVGRGASVTKF